MNPKMVKRTPHPGPFPIGSADAEREKRSLRFAGITPVATCHLLPRRGQWREALEPGK